MPTVIKDTFLFFSLFLVTSLVVGIAYSTTNSIAKLWFSVSIFLIFTIVWFSQRRQASRIKSSEGIVYATSLLFTFALLVIFREAIFGKIRYRPDFVTFSFAFFSIISVISNSLGVAVFLPRHTNIYWYLFAISCFSILFGLFWPMGIILVFSIEGVRFFLTLLVIFYIGWVVGIQRISKILAVLFSSLWGILLGGIIGIAPGLVFGMLGAMVGAVIGSIVGVVIVGRKAIQDVMGVTTKEFLKGIAEDIFGTIGLQIFLSLVLLVMGLLVGLNAALFSLSVLLFLSIYIREKPLESFSKNLRYAFLFLVASFEPMYYLYSSQSFKSPIFSLLVLFSAISLIISQVFLLANLINKNTRQRILDRITPFSPSQSIYNLLVIAMTYAILFTLSYVLLQNYPSQKYIPLVISFCCTFLFLKNYNQIFLYFSQASLIEKKDIENDPNTLFCQKHFLRPIQMTNSLLYSSYECPFPGCGKKHLLAGIKEVVGFIDAPSIGLNQSFLDKAKKFIGKTTPVVVKFSETLQENSMLVSLWDHKSKQSRYAEIDRLEVRYSKGLKKEDYNYAIQSVVSKICHSMDTAKREKVRVDIHKGVTLSEASKRLLKDNFTGELTG